MSNYKLKSDIHIYAIYKSKLVQVGRLESYVNEKSFEQCIKLQGQLTGLKNSVSGVKYVF